MPGGRPSSYKPEYADLAYKFALLGVTDKQLADFLDVTEKTVNNWKHEYPEFLQSLKDGKEFADAKVAEALYKKATGFSYEDKYYPPDTAAAFIWLKNRAGWKDRQELTGADGGPLTISYDSAFKKL